MKKPDRQKRNATISNLDQQRDIRRKHSLFPDQYDIGEKEDICWSRPLRISFSQLCSLIIIFITSLSGSSFAATRYVWTNSPSPGTGFLTWSTAAHTIQDSVDVAVSNDVILVTNGVYDTGGRVISGYSLTNRVVITNGVSVRSINGPGVTIIRGSWSPVTTNGDEAVRCVYVGSNALLSGFTLTNGATREGGNYYFEEVGGGAWCDASGVLSNCTLSGNAAGGGGGAYGGILNNCTLSGNSAFYGGGAFFGILNNCILSENMASAEGGGAMDCSLSDCTISRNYAEWFGGGVEHGTLNNCMISMNYVFLHYGGGVDVSTLTNCVISNNYARKGGGSCDSRLNNCIVSSNRVADSGGGAYGGWLNSCTIIGNSAGTDGGGVNCSTVNNSIVYFNTAGWGSLGVNAYDSELNYCCFDPIPQNNSTARALKSTGNITNDPQLVSIAGCNYRLRASSPCVDTGNNADVHWIGFFSSPTSGGRGPDTLWRVPWTPLFCS